MRSIHVHRVALADVADALDYYIDQAPHVADRFLGAVDRAITAVARGPGAGSPRYAELLDVPGLRARSVHGFPYVVLYRFDATSITIGRVLHQASELEGLFHDDPT